MENAMNYLTLVTLFLVGCNNPANNIGKCFSPGSGYYSYKVVGVLEHERYDTNSSTGQSDTKTCLDEEVPCGQFQADAREFQTKQRLQWLEDAVIKIISTHLQDHTKGSTK